MGLIHVNDFVDLWYKLKERGSSYAIKKFFSSANQRVLSTWQVDEVPGSNWWQVDEIRSRWNALITGNRELEYPDYVVNKYLKTADNVSMLSIGCGTGMKEISFGKHKQFSHIDAFDISPTAINDAIKNAANAKVNCCHFFVDDVYRFPFSENTYDVVLFHSSLHHFTAINDLLKQVKQTLKPGGYLIINEYTGASRFQFNAHRKSEVQKVYDEKVPDVFKTRKLSTQIKRKVYFPGYLRMVLSDPSEAADSANILSALDNHFTVVELKPYGGNLLTFLLKDIAHHFNKPETTALLHELFEIENEWMKTTNQSDFNFGVYVNQKQDE